MEFASSMISLSPKLSSFSSSALS
uniref:Uncharacterized protein n=1 Tax=Rhizophora mucronata TaxID=61149 RepID=A0A2P2QFY0_RHIMU